MAVVSDSCCHNSLQKKTAPVTIDTRIRAPVSVATCGPRVFAMNPAARLPMGIKPHTIIYSPVTRLLTSFGRNLCKVALDIEK